jgi:arylsulfatase A-like enzyme
MDYQRLSREDYRSRYARYGEQVVFIQSQLNYLFAQLNARGLFEPMTIVVHGDHGSRILAQREGMAKLDVSGPASVARFDYAGRPDKQDLRDRFSILFAAKRGGRRMGEIRSNPVSLLSVITTYTGVTPLPEEPSASASYLFDGAGKPVGISMLDEWRP